MTRPLQVIAPLVLTIFGLAGSVSTQQQVSRRLLVNLFVTGGTSFIIEGPISSPKIYQSLNGTDYHPLTIAKCECGDQEGFVVFVTDPLNPSRGQFQVSLSRRGFHRPYIINIAGDPNIYTDVGRVDFSKYKFHP